MSFKPVYKLLNWIPENKLNLINLSKNENAVHILEKNASRICWSIWLYMNPNAVHIVEQHLKELTDINRLDDIYWDELSANPNAVRLLFSAKSVIIKSFFMSFSKIIPFFSMKVSLSKGPDLNSVLKVDPTVEAPGNCPICSMSLDK